MNSMQTPGTTYRTAAGNKLCVRSLRILSKHKHITVNPSHQITQASQQPARYIDTTAWPQ
jgi:hypothetical protein